MWKHGKRWVYSITYDEGCRGLLEHAVPLHRRYGIPGHVALLASQVGVPRNVPGSSYDGMRILSRSELEALCAEGWGISCHGMTHAAITPGNARHEVIEARQLLEQTLQRPVRLFCVPNNNASYPAALPAAVEAGFLAVMTVTDRLNVPGSLHQVHPSGAVPAGAPPPLERRILTLGRVPLHSEYPPPFYSAFDPYKRLHQARDLGAWVIDYCHCPVPGRAIHPWKDCTAEELGMRFETVRRVGGDEVWLAEPGEVVDYLLGAAGNPEGKGTLAP